MKKMMMIFVTSQVILNLIQWIEFEQIVWINLKSQRRRINKGQKKTNPLWQELVPAELLLKFYKDLKVKNEIKMCVSAPEHKQIITKISLTHMHPPNNLLILGCKDPKTIK